MGDRCGKCGRRAGTLHGKDHLCSRCFNAGKPRREKVSPGKKPTRAENLAAMRLKAAARMRNALKGKRG